MNRKADFFTKRIDSNRELECSSVSCTLYDVICKRSLAFAIRCIASESELVRHISHYGIFRGRTHSTMGHYASLPADVDGLMLYTV